MAAASVVQARDALADFVTNVGGRQHGLGAFDAHLEALKYMWIVALALRRSVTIIAMAALMMCCG